MYYNNKRLALSLFWVILGAVLMGCSLAEILDSSICSGMGGALLAIGILQLFKNLRYRKDSDFRERVDTQIVDERNRFLRLKSWSWAGYIAVLAEAAGVVAAWIMGKDTVMQVLSSSVCLILAVYWIAYLILSRKY